MSHLTVTALQIGKFRWVDGKIGRCVLSEGTGEYLNDIQNTYEFVDGTRKSFPILTPLEEISYVEGMMAFRVFKK